MLSIAMVIKIYEQYNVFIILIQVPSGLFLFSYGIRHKFIQALISLFQSLRTCQGLTMHARIFFLLLVTNPKTDHTITSVNDRKYKKWQWHFIFPSEPLVKLYLNPAKTKEQKFKGCF